MSSATACITLREALDSDLATFFEHQLDPEATRMANFPSRGHDAFFAHWAKVRANPVNITKTVIYQGEIAGNICSWPAEDKRLVGYWIGREFWSRGIATAALAAFLKVVTHRPLYAYVAKHNAGSIRVLEKCGFELCKEAAKDTQHEAASEEYLYAIR
jgi:RimJ/RimL family protein N-acetyltransferase